MFPLVGTVFEVSSWYESLARLASAVALWASVKAEHRQPTPEEAMEDLTLRLRHPWKYRLARVWRLLH